MGTTVIQQPQQPQQPQIQSQQHLQATASLASASARKGILKRTPVNPNQESVQQQQPLSGGSNTASMASTASTIGAASAGAGAMSQNKWDYELSPSSSEAPNKSEHGGHEGHRGREGQHGLHSHHHHQHHHVHGSRGGVNKEREPDILQLPMGLPPPPGTSTAISGKIFLLWVLNWVSILDVEGL